MSTKLGDLLAKKFDEPDEIRQIKEYVAQKFQAQVGVAIKTNEIIILVSSSALAGSLHAQLHTLQRQLKTKKRLIIRVQ